MGLKTGAGEGSKDMSTLERTKARREGEGRTAVPDESHGSFELRPEAVKEKEGQKEREFQLGYRRRNENEKGKRKERHELEETHACKTRTKQARVRTPVETSPGTKGSSFWTRFLMVLQKKGRRERKRREKEMGISNVSALDLPFSTRRTERRTSIESRVP